MSWNFSPDKAIFQQIMDKITIQVISGKYSLEEKLPSVRELATEAGVNPNTMQKALSELEREGILSSKRGDGRYVAESSAESKERKQRLINDRIAAAVSSLRELGLSDDKILESIKFYFEEMSK